MDALEIIKQFENKNHNFNLGAYNVKVTVENDVKLIFGIDCGDKQIDLMYGLKDQQVVMRIKITSDSLTT